MKSIEDVAAARLLSLGLVVPIPGGAREVVSRLVCLQGQDLRGALESVALRTGTRDLDAVVAAFDDGSVVRSWTQRGTLHLVASTDVGWLLDLTGARMEKSMARRRTGLGISDEMLSQAADLAAALLGERGRVSRQELLAAWEPLGVATTPGRGYHLIVALAIRQVLVQGPLTATGSLDQLFVLSEGWLPAQRHPSREEAVEELVCRYVRGHGPVTFADIVRWVGLPVTEVRAGAAANLAAGAVASSDIDGVIHLHAPELPDLLTAHRRAAQETLLLPGFDELILGYRDRRATVEAAHEALIVPGGNGMFKGTIIDRFRAVGTWRRTRRVSGPRFETTAFPGCRLDQRRIMRAALAYPVFAGAQEPSRGTHA